MRQYLRLFLLLSFSVFVTACASNSNEQKAQVANNQQEEYVDERDPFEPFNREMWDFNWDVLDKHILRPLAVGFTKLPDPAQDGVRNFVSNLEEPGNMVNNLLQGKVTDSGASLGRFVLNTTVGVFGLFDVATHVGIKRKDETFKETLAVAGVGNGPFLMLPGMGPTTVRDTTGNYVDGLIYPLSILSLPESILRFGLKAIYTRADLLPQDTLINQSADSYEFVKSAYFQNQEFKVHDGNPPLEEEDEFDDEFLDEID